MVRALNERKPRNDFWCGVEFKRAPPGARRSDVECGHQPKITFGGRHRGDNAGCTHMWDERNGETKMKARGIAHESIARREIGMNGKRCLHKGKCRNDYPPDALDRVEGQYPFVPLYETSHHLGFARGAEGRCTTVLTSFNRNQTVNDLATLDQKLMHSFVDAVDLLAKVSQCGGFGCFRHGGIDKWAEP